MQDILFSDSKCKKFQTDHTAIVMLKINQKLVKYSENDVTSIHLTVIIIYLFNHCTLNPLIIILIVFLSANNTISIKGNVFRIN